MTNEEMAAWLRRAADKIEPEGAWTQGAPARNAKGEVVQFASPEATCWCLTGAIAVTSTHKWTHWDDPEKWGLFIDHNHSAILEVTTVALKLLRQWSLAGYNDTPGRTQSEVVAALRAGADLAEKEIA